MKSAVQAQKDIKFIVSLVRGLAAFSDEIDAAGSLEKLTAEKQAEVAKLQAEADKIAGRLADADKQAKAIVDGANARAESIAQKARDQMRAADDLRAAGAADFEAAQRTAAKLVADAETRAKQIIADANTAKDKIDGAAYDAAAHLTDIQSQVAEAEARRDAAHAELDRLKSVFGK